ncbi:hypothetical protein FBULB1_4614 [Fusarium bulbicola]|nr:hypothetical protein FBULB1_4614 [Fusarium bulbicola]
MDSCFTALSGKDDTENGLTPDTYVTETDTSETDESMSDVLRIVKAEKDLDAHLRQDPACEVVSPSREMPGIDNETKERLKSRRGIQNFSEEEKWKHMYKVLFPNAEDIPSPYRDLQILEAPMTAEHGINTAGF